jgi:hypothetical protein
LLTPFVGLKFAGQTRIVVLETGGAGNAKFALGAIASRLGDGLFGLEADVGYVPRFFERASGNLISSSHVLTVMGNVVLAAPRSLTGYALRPFLSGGAGLMHIGIDDIAGALPVDTKHFAVNVGGGASGGLTDLTSVRFELRYFRSMGNSNGDNISFGSTNLSFWRAGVGLTLRY